MAVVVVVVVVVGLEGWTGAVLHPRISRIVMAGKLGVGERATVVLIFGRFQQAEGTLAQRGPKRHEEALTVVLCFFIYMLGGSCRLFMLSPSLALIPLYR